MCHQMAQLGKKYTLFGFLHMGRYGYRLLIFHVGLIVRPPWWPGLAKNKMAASDPIFTDKIASNIFVPGFFQLQ